MTKNNTRDINISDSVLYEDNHLIVINKPAGALVQGDKTPTETASH